MMSWILGASSAKKSSAKNNLSNQQMDIDVNLVATEDEKLQAANADLC